MEQIYPFLTSVLDGSQWSKPHPSYFTPGKEPQFPLNRRQGALQRWSGHFEGEESLVPARIQDPDRPLHTVVNTPTTLSLLLYICTYTCII
jgi:hypothetical protein